MVNEQLVNIVMPVKDALNVAERAIKAVLATGETLTVWNDRSTKENTERLHRLQQQWGFTLIDVETLTDKPSPNYRLLLLKEQEKALQTGAHLIIVESDVIVRQDTFSRLLQAAGTEKAGMVAAITVDEQGEINYPYLYARKRRSLAKKQKHLSFCCTLLTQAFLQACPFSQLDETKNWYDVTLSHQSLALGFQNLLITDVPVLHLPHSSRPWKQLKYTNPLKYYWLKLWHGRDKI